MRFRASKPVYRRENRFGPGPHTDIIRQVDPTNRASRINQEFGGPRGVFTSLAALRMDHPVLSDRLTIGIGKKWKRIPSRLAELPGLGRRIHTDSHDFKAASVKLVQALLETP